MSTNEKFEFWCVIELFGHTQLAGLVTEATIGGQSFIRVDVPGVDGRPEFTKFLGSGAIYSMTPVSEEIVRSALAYIRPRPVEVYMLPKPAEPEPSIVEGEEYDEDTAWACGCGNYIEDGMHCDQCGGQPPWGCDCSQCQDDEEYDEESYGTEIPF